MSQLHDRQPAILVPDAYDAWLDPETPAADVKPLLAENLDGDLRFHRFDRRVNSSSKTNKPNDGALRLGTREADPAKAGTSWLHKPLMNNMLSR